MKSRFYEQGDMKMESDCCINVEFEKALCIDGIITEILKYGWARLIRCISCVT